MKGLFLLIVGVAGVYGDDKAHHQGVGSYAYQDSTGNRYSGTYTIKDGKVTHHKHDPKKNNVETSNVNEIPLDIPVPLKEVEETSFGIPSMILPFNQFNPGNDFFGTFFQDYFRNIERVVQQFSSPPYYFGPDTMGPNSAYAYGSIGNRFQHQIAAINPENLAQMHLTAMKELAAKNQGSSNGQGNQNDKPIWFHQEHYQTFSSSQNNPNVDEVSGLSDRFGGSSGPGYNRVSSSAFSSSSNVNGKQVNRQMAHTLVDNNGDVKEYVVHN